MKKRTYQKIGLALIILGILVVNLKSFLMVTGAVVGVSTVVSRTSFWVGLVFIMSGFVLVLLGYNSIPRKNTTSRIPKKKKEKTEHNYPTKEELKRFKKRFHKKKELEKEIKEKGL